MELWNSEDICCNSSRGTVAFCHMEKSTVWRQEYNASRSYLTLKDRTLAEFAKQAEENPRWKPVSLLETLLELVQEARTA